MTILSYQQLKQLAANAGFPSNLTDTMAAIALAESSGNPNALNPTDNGGTQSSFGLWQISTGTHVPPAPNWMVPSVNAALAYQKWRTQGLRAWGTYNSGAYKRYLGGAGYTGSSGPGGGSSGVSSGGSGSGSSAGGSGGSSSGGTLTLSDVTAASAQMAQNVTMLLDSATGNGTSTITGFDSICVALHDAESFHADTKLLTSGNPGGWFLAVLIDNSIALSVRGAFMLLALLLVIYSLSDVIEYAAGLALLAG